MPCILCHRRLAAPPLPVCTECREQATHLDEARYGPQCADGTRNCWKPANARVNHRPRYTPRPQTEAPETD